MKIELFQTFSETKQKQFSITSWVYFQKNEERTSATAETETIREFQTLTKHCYDQKLVRKIKEKFDLEK